MRVCCTCGIEKSLNEFGADRHRPLAKRYQCKACHNFANNKYRNKNPALIRAQRYRRKFWPDLPLDDIETGIDLQYEHLFKKQKGKCALCEKSKAMKNMHVDFCEETKKVRGLLCWRCNRFEVGNRTVAQVRALFNYMGRS